VVDGRAVQRYGGWVCGSVPMPAPEVGSATMSALGRYLRTVASAVPVIGDVSQAATAAAGLVALVLGGGVVLGVAISPAAGLVIALAVLLVLAVLGGVRLQARLDAFQRSTPVVEIGDTWQKREAISSERVPRSWFYEDGTLGGEPPELHTERAEIVGFYVVNRGTAAAEHVWAELAFARPDGSHLLTITARPSHAPRASDGEPLEGAAFTEITLPPNGKPEPFDVALRFEDGKAYALNTRSLILGGRYESFELAGAPFVVTAHVRGGGGLDAQRRWRCNGGATFELIADDG
jgi:hypothetical protein